MPSVKEYIASKERAIVEIQRGVQQKAVEMERGTREVAKAIAEYGVYFGKSLEKFTKQWYG